MRTTSENRFKCIIHIELPYSTITGKSEISHRLPRRLSTRLKVPKIRSVLEYTNFLILFILYVVAMEGLEDDRLNKREMAFVIYALGKLPVGVELN